MCQTTILQLQMVECEGTIHPAGVRSPHPITVSVTDEAGRPVAGAAVSFHLPDTGPGGAFLNGLRTDVAVTDERGRATVRAFHANRVPGRFQIRVLASKEHARAGTVSFQYVGQLRTSGGHRKWVAVAAVVAGGALAGVLTRGSAAVVGVAPPVVTPPPVVTIGPPAISVGKP
jgi:hypothetical protein